MTLRSFLLPFATLLGLSTPSWAGDAVRLDVRTWSTDTYRGERARTGTPPRGVVGVLPEREGDPFTLSIDPGLYTGGSEEEVRRALEELLPVVGYTGGLRDLQLVSDTKIAPVDQTTIDEDGRAGLERLEEDLTRRFGEISEVTKEALRYQMDEEQVLLGRSLRVQRWDLVLDGLDVDGLGLTVELDGDGQIIGLSGALSNAGRLSGDLDLSSEKAEALATRALSKQARVLEVTDPVAGALATGEQILPVWTMDLQTTGGPYRVTVDASSGEILAVELNASFLASAQGPAFQVDPYGAPSLAWFDVDDAQNGQFTLNLSGVREVVSGGQDGCSGAVSVPQGNGFADFDVAPWNVPNVQVASDPDYNCHFQELNTTGAVSGALDGFYALGAIQLWPMTIQVDEPDACYLGINNSCAINGDLIFGIGTGTRDGGSTDADLYNPAVDSTAVIHELGHLISLKHAITGGSKMTSSESEGLSDFWADALLYTDTNGAWTAQNRGAPSETGYWPRQVTDLDVFPEHMHLYGGNTEVHANGQILAWALWNVRAGLMRRAPNGQNDVLRLLLTALLHANKSVSQTVTDKNVYASYQGVMLAMLQDATDDETRIDVVQGFARAGIYASSDEAIIDISDDYLSKHDAPPTFTVWSGPDFTFDASGAATDATPSHPYLQITVANDYGFTANVAKSPLLTSLAPDAGGNTMTTWQLPQSAWDKLGSGSLVYYKVTAWDTYVADSITSLSTEGGAMALDPAAAVVTDGGINGCSTAGGRPALLGALLGLALALRRRA